MVAGDVLAAIAEVDELLHGLALDEHAVQVLEPLLIFGFKVAAIGGLTALEDADGAVLELGAQVESLAFGKVRLSVIFHLVIEELFHKLVTHHDVGLDRLVFCLFLLDPLDGVVQQIGGKRDDVIAWH